MGLLSAATTATTHDVQGNAVDYARHGWRVFPLRGKEPLGSCRQCRREPRCPGPHACGHELCHGVRDATTDPGVIRSWWARWPAANIGARVPEPLIAVDVDPRHGGHGTVAAWEAEHGPLPATLTVASGRGDGGAHYYYRRPAGRLTGGRLRGTGVDLRTSAGYCVVPPSTHPDSGRPDTWADLRDPAAPPRWLADLLRPPAPTQRPTAPVWRPSIVGASVADDYTSSTSWADVLAPHGWRCLDADPDADGARWRHPAAASAVSATVRHGLLFVYTTSTALPVTEAGGPHGLTRFRAHAVLDHGGDLSAAARSLRQRRAAE